MIWWLIKFVVRCLALIVWALVEFAIWLFYDPAQLRGMVEFARGKCQWVLHGEDF